MDELDSNLKVGEAVAIRQAFYELLDTASSAERQYLLDEVTQEADFRQAVETHVDLSDIALKLGTLVNRTNDQQQATDEGDSTNHQNQLQVEQLLQDLEDDPETETRAIQRQIDIADTHSLVKSYEQELKQAGKIPTAKQVKTLSRALKREYRSRWSADELADDPERLSTILDSVTCKEGVSPVAQKDVLKHITGEVAQYVMQTAAETTPDTIAKRLSASLTPSFSQPLLQECLLKPYVKSAEGRGLEVIIDNYERLARGVLRTVTQPDICRKGMDIIGFKTEVIPEHSLYKTYANDMTAVRLDRPDLFARSGAVKKLVAILEIHQGTSIEMVPDGFTNIFEQYQTEISRILAGGIPSKEAIAATRKNFGTVAISESTIAVQALGAAEYNKRLNSMKLMTEFMSQPGGIEKYLSEYISQIDAAADEDEFFDLDNLQLTDIIINYVRQHNPEAGEYIASLLNTRTSVLDEVPLFIHEIVSDPVGAMKALNPADKQRALETIKNAYAEDLADEDPESMNQMLEYDMVITENPTDDGYVIGILTHKDDQASVQSGWDDLISTVASVIEPFKAELAQTTGMGRRFKTFGIPSLGMRFIIRPESEEDRKATHPINSLLESFEDLADETRSNEAIEICNQTINQERRRFLNDRGIIYIFKPGDEINIGEFHSIQINKHPRNPQNFVVTVEKVVDGTTRSVKLLMDEGLRFQLGDKKVKARAALSNLNVLSALFLTHFMCEEAIDTEDGEISDKKNTITKRIAHLRLLPEGHKYSYEQWSHCLEAEGLDLEVLSDQQAIKYVTNRNSTYVRAVEHDDPTKGPLRIY
jgi:hypothetical protein